MNNSFTLPKLRVSISDRCQLNCSFCGGEKNRMENFQPDYLNNKLLDTKILYDIIESYISNGGSYVQFTGGEPLLQRNLYDMISFTKKAGGIPEINTNGIAFSYRRAYELAELGINVVKISIPSFIKEKYKRITGVDCLEKVFHNISLAKNVVEIRLNMVVTREVIEELENAIDICLSLGVTQLLLLELLYYPHVKGGYKYFASQYVDIIGTLNKRIEKKIGNPLKPFYFNNIFESLYCAEANIVNFRLFAKQALSTLRIDGCNYCKHYCQEGVYELRLSTGGYLSFCNTTNEYGVDLSQASPNEIKNIFDYYNSMFSKTSECSFEDFLNRYKVFLL